jgi:hypothetical protein
VINGSPVNEAFILRSVLADYIFCWYLIRADHSSKESWAIEWDNLLGNYDGLEIAEAVTAGQYGSKTNIWGIAMVL